MSSQSDPLPIYLPRMALHRLHEVDAEAERVRSDLNWLLASFIAVFDDNLHYVLVVQLGDYAQACYGGHPWTLPGGSVEPHESPSTAICREVEEETGLTVDPGMLRPAGWFPRPYFQPYRCRQSGELLLLFATTANIADTILRPSPPETKDAQFHPFSLPAFLAVPAFGVGEHRLQPLPRHWAFWASIGQTVLRDQLRPPLVHVYSSASSMTLAP